MGWSILWGQHFTRPWDKSFMRGPYTTMGTVCSSALLGSLVDLDVLDDQVSGVKTLCIRVCLCVLEETEEEFGRLYWPSSPGYTECLACRSILSTLPFYSHLPWVVNLYLAQHVQFRQHIFSLGQPPCAPGHSQGTWLLAATSNRWLLVPSLLCSWSSLGGRHHERERSSSGGFLLLRTEPAEGISRSSVSRTIDSRWLLRWQEPFLRTVKRMLGWIVSEQAAVNSWSRRRAAFPPPAVTARPLQNIQGIERYSVQKKKDGEVLPSWRLCWCRLLWGCLLLSSFRSSWISFISRLAGQIHEFCPRLCAPSQFKLVQRLVYTIPIMNFFKPLRLWNFGKSTTRLIDWIAVAQHVVSNVCPHTLDCLIGIDILRFVFWIHSLEEMLEFRSQPLENFCWYFYEQWREVKLPVHPASPQHQCGRKTKGMPFLQSADTCF